MSNIEQADRIVGIEGHIMLNKTTCSFNEGTYRRGAYIEWLAVAGNAYWPSGTFDARMTVSQMAEHIVRLDAASKPKGDGLPEALFVGSQTVSGCAAVGVVAKRNGLHEWMGMTDEEQNATSDYIRRCLSAPVRRFLAAFDVVDNNPNEGPIQATALVQDYLGNATIIWCINHTKAVCWLVPKGNK